MVEGIAGGGSLRIAYIVATGVGRFHGWRPVSISCRPALSGTHLLGELVGGMPLRTTKSWFGVVLDTRDAQALARFYADLLGWQVFTDDPGWATVAPSKDAGYNLAFQREEHHVRPVWPAGPGDPEMQLHLDLEVDDLEQAVAWARECGAELAQFQPQETVRVLLDPAGHPFCLYVDDGSD